MDGKTALFILRLAGINTSQVKYLNQGDWEEGYINLDTGNRTGVVSEQAGKTAFFDHHGIIADTATCAAQLTYETMVKLGLLERTAALDKMVRFVTQLDNKAFPNEERYYKNSDRTILGLQGFIRPDNLLKFFEQSRKQPTAILTDKKLADYGLIGKSKEMTKRLKQSEEEFKKAQIIETPKYGKVVIDDGKKIPLGYNTALANGCGGYVAWSPDKNEFKVYTKTDLPNNFLPQGQLIRGKMWIKPFHDGEELKVSLEDIVNALKS